MCNSSFLFVRHFPPNDLRLSAHCNNLTVWILVFFIIHLSIMRSSSLKLSIHKWNMLILKYSYFGERERKEISHSLLHLWNACNSQCWTRLKSGAGISIQASLWVLGPKHCVVLWWPLGCAPPGIWSGMWSQISNPSTPVWDAGIKQQINHLTKCMPQNMLLRMLTGETQSLAQDKNYNTHEPVSKTSSCIFSTQSLSLRQGRQLRSVRAEAGQAEASMPCHFWGFWVVLISISQIITTNSPVHLQMVKGQLETFWIL